MCISFPRSFSWRWSEHTDWNIEFVNRRFFSDPPLYSKKIFTWCDHKPLFVKFPPEGSCSKSRLCKNLCEKTALKVAPSWWRVLAMPSLVHFVAFFVNWRHDALKIVQMPTVFKQVSIAKWSSLYCNILNKLIVSYYIRELIL